jgi:hypothetical protein
MADKPRIQGDRDYGHGPLVVPRYGGGVRSPDDLTSGVARVLPEVPKIEITRGAYVRYVGPNHTYRGKVARVFWIDDMPAGPYLYLQFANSRRDWQISALTVDVRAIVDDVTPLTSRRDDTPWPQ